MDLVLRKRLILILVFLTFLRLILGFLKSLPLDMSLFLAWSSDLGENGFSEFYEKWKETDPYPPFSLYLLWISGKIAKIFSQSQICHEFLIKFWAILFEILGAFLIYQIAKNHQREKLGLILAVFFLANPAILFNSYLWGQLDSLLATLLFFTIYLFEIKKPLWGIFAFCLSFFTKPQAIFLTPLVLFLWQKDLSLKKFFLTLFLSLFTVIFLFLPFLRGKSPFWIISYHLERLNKYPYATANAFNFWMLFGGQTTFDRTPFLGLNYALWGLILVFICQVLVIFLVWKNKDDSFFLYFGSFLALFGSFLFGTRMHERYLIPSLIFLYASLIWRPELLKLLLGITLSIFGNVYYIWWRVWEGFSKNDPLFLWAPKDDKFGILISLLTLFLFFYSLFLIFKAKLKFPKNFKMPSLAKHFFERKEDESEKKRSLIFIFLILFLSFFTRLILIWHPPEVVFDEVHYGKAVNGYFRGEYFFTGHPPLGSQLIALGGLLGNYKPIFPFENIGEKFTNNSYISLRIPPALAGALIPLVAYFFLQTIGFSQIAAFFSSLFLIFENALLVQSKFILIDSFWILFGFLSLLFFFKAKEKNYNLWFLILSGIFLGGALATKWTSLSFGLFLFPFALFDLGKKFFFESWKSFFLLFGRIFLGLAMFSLFVYLLVFFLHFKLLAKSGPGDIFMSQEFLRGEKNFFEKFIELNKVSYETNIKAKLEHPYSSKFYTWPFLLRPIYYWNGEGAKIYLIGNPILWWLSTLAVFLLCLLWIFDQRIRRDKVSLIILWGYLSSLLPYLQVQRCTFLYHYFPGLIFSIFAFGGIFDKIKGGKWFPPLVLLLIFISFLYFAPLSYGLSLPVEEWQKRMWLKSWF